MLRWPFFITLPISLIVHLKFKCSLWYLNRLAEYGVLTLALKGNLALLIRPETLSCEIIERSDSVSVSHSVSMSV